MKNYFFLGLLFISSMVLAQEREISGTITDAEGLPLIGVNIIIEGTNRGTQSDFDGNYSIVADEGQVLVYSFVGFSPEKRTVGTQSVINVNLSADNTLEEVVVVGYGTQSKRKVTDNISSISADEINNIPVANMQSALVGKAAGVQITQINGKVEGGVKMRVRGVASISSSLEPLYVVDGMPLINDDESTSEAPINPLISINPNDIESIEILKDASSAAIYGARGTNGVVLITTKQGRAGKTTVSINTSSGWSRPTNKVEWLNAEEYIMLMQEASAYTYGSDDEWLIEEDGYFDWMANGLDWRNGAVDTDWQDYALVDGAVQDHTVSVSGGNDKTRFFLSGGYNRTEAIIRGNDLERYSIRSNIDHDVSERLSVGFNSGISKTHISRIGTDNSFSTPLQAVAQSPISPAYLEDGIIPNNESTIYYNFLMQEYNGDWDSNIFRVLINTYAQYELLPGLNFRTEVGYDNNNQTEEYFAGSMTESASTNGYADANAVQSDKYNLNNYFNYSTTFAEDYDLDLVLGMSFEESTRSRQYTAVPNFLQMIFKQWQVLRKLSTEFLPGPSTTFSPILVGQHSPCLTNTFSKEV
ncbi:SusC/RagA family TonB-linked outer membrane protein [Antarcticibacterium sp. 1MA-6-2]|uniref:SusC/RagA family TonB-linked outer membrane protein n=1 Tax=Antarcticibacterium sp. 1MA-6-2 TaxID=2908210 RepID=UPI001F244DD4|nr:SusC/RagA family TonB-linked outer membrane protein [Antarcticibacterium sp. 1MA-6-2]UJH89879.1 SusC/RagA family TonB-linked outer membrane protein [Antarcticibacterium sp. 1MA-6-2]